MAKSYVLKRRQELPISVEEAWDFFSSPANLKKITPDFLGFTVTSENREKMYTGMIITYVVKPVLGIPLRWMTEIKHVEDHIFFVDEQRVGPFRIWHHQHHFTKTDKGVMMEDIVNYILPLGILGRFAHWLFVKNKLEGIFDFRFKICEDLFDK